MNRQAGSGLSQEVSRQFSALGFEKKCIEVLGILGFGIFVLTYVIYYTVKIALLKLLLVAAGKRLPRVKLPELICKIFCRYFLPAVREGHPSNFTCALSVNYPHISLRHYYSVFNDIQRNYLWLFVVKSKTQLLIAFF